MLTLTIAMASGCGGSDGTIGTAGGTAAALAASYNGFVTCGNNAFGTNVPTVTAADISANCDANDINIGTRVAQCFTNGNLCGIVNRTTQPNPNLQALAAEGLALKNNCFGIAEKANPRVSSSCEALLPDGI